MNEHLPDQPKTPSIPTMDRLLDPKQTTDADLAVLACAPDKYGQYTANIRAEYDFLSDRQYARIRTDFIIGLLQRERIFASDIGHNTLDTQARRNMLAELDRLEVW